MMNWLCYLTVFLCVCVASVFGADCTVSNPDKIDCGYSGITQSQCENKGCCWQPEGHNSVIPWCFYQASHTCAFNTTSFPGAPFSTSQVSLMSSYFLKNIDIDGKGGVVASPDKNTPGGSYYYHWERDAALSMHALMIASNFADINDKMEAYVGWVLHVQSEVDPHGIDVLTEPKYLLPDGQVFPGGWCRPQTDGPALRSTTLIEYANVLLEKGQSDYVKKYLWTGTSAYGGGAIKVDVDWVAANWTENGCDLWEEIRSDNFFWNRFNFRRSLLLGAEFATKMGDSNSAAKYKQAAQAVNATLNGHWTGSFVYESTNREKDSAVIVAFNDGYNNDGVFGPQSNEVVSTIMVYNALFCNSYEINQVDNKKGIPGILYGRYQGDHYAGGNPWILSTNALAELFYRGATAVLKDGLPSDKVMRVWGKVLQKDFRNLKQLGVSGFSKALASGGDSILDRVAYHVRADDFHLSEQLSRTDGSELSATDLTWSYATVLKAMYFRSQYVSLFTEKYNVSPNF